MDSHAASALCAIERIDEESSHDVCSVRQQTVIAVEPPQTVTERARRSGCRAPGGSEQHGREITLTKNNLMELLPRSERTRLMAIAEPFDLVLSRVLCEPGSPTRHVYFPTNGFISLVTAVPGHPGVEVGMVGSEGMVGGYLALDVCVEPLHAVVQGQGSAPRVATEPFLLELSRSPVLRATVHRYLYVLMAQLAAYMLGVRRVGITTAASGLKRGRLIEYPGNRGLYVLRSRPQGL